MKRARKERKPRCKRLAPRTRPPSKTLSRARSALRKAMRDPATPFTHITSKELVSMRAAYTAGLSLKDIAAKSGRSYSAVQKHSKDENWESYKIAFGRKVADGMQRTLEEQILADIETLENLHTSLHDEIGQDLDDNQRITQFLAVLKQKYVLLSRVKDASGGSSFTDLSAEELLAKQAELLRLVKEY